MCDRHELVVCQPLVAQLHDVHAARGRGTQEVRKLVSSRRRVEDHVQPRGGQPLTSLRSEVVAWHRLEVWQAEVRLPAGWG
jgi:hypothetical protein